MPNPLTAGKLGHALRWSPVGIALGIAIGVGVMFADIIAWRVGRTEFIESHFHSALLTVFVVLTLGSLNVHLKAREMIYLRRMRFEQPHAVVPRQRRKRRVVKGMTPEMIEMARRLSSRLRPTQ